MKTWSKTEILILIILVLPFGYLAFTWNEFPARVPIHFNHKGEADNYGPKAFGLLLLPVINILLFLLLKYLPKIDPRKENYVLFEGRYKAIRLIIHIFLTFIFFLLVSSMLKGSSSLLHPKLVIIGFALLTMVLGNYFSAVRPNFFVGVRTPWTLSNEEVWKKTHRFTGRLWVASSFLLLLYALFFEDINKAVIFVFIGVITIPPIVYSYLIYQKISKPNGLHH